MTSRKQPAGTSALEWIAAAIGLAMLLAVFAVIGREAMLAETAQPPSITVQAQRVVTLEHGFLVEFVASNSSTATAAAVTIEGRIQPANGPEEVATATLDYVAGNSRVKGGLFFQSDPRKGGVTLRPLGYQEP
jgi:uncharacterized protein (TIGR02588 family)